MARLTSLALGADPGPVRYSTYGLRNLVDRYLMRDRRQQLIELTQRFFILRVAMGVLRCKARPRAVWVHDMPMGFDYAGHSDMTLFAQARSLAAVELLPHLNQRPDRLHDLGTGENASPRSSAPSRSG